MTGSDIIGALLLADSAITDKVPAARIKEDALPDAIALPALLVRDRSSVERIELRREGTVRARERVEVTVRAGNSRDRKEIMALVRQCCAGKVGSVGGGTNVYIQAAGRGPSLQGPAMSFEQSDDFMVSFDTDA